MIAHLQGVLVVKTVERVVLDVDTENPSGARGLYDNAGFEEKHRSMALTKEF